MVLLRIYFPFCTVLELVYNTCKDPPSLEDATNVLKTFNTFITGIVLADSENTIDIHNKGDLDRVGLLHVHCHGCYSYTRADDNVLPTDSN